MAGILLAGCVVLAAVVLQSVSGAARALQWQRGTETGTSWLTAHLCHWSWNHLVWDVSVFVVLSLLSLRMTPEKYPGCLLVAALLIMFEIQWNQPELEAYRGLSGIDCALLGLVVAALWRRGKARGARWLAAIASASFVGKSIYELLTGKMLFVEELGAHQFVPVVSAHLVGFVSGVLVGAWNTMAGRKPAIPAGRMPAALQVHLPNWMLAIFSAMSRFARKTNSTVAARLMRARRLRTGPWATPST
jgi:rhomboid family GlyGly-CTERM serine protease